jgi:hypothetical protein
MFLSAHSTHQRARLRLHPGGHEGGEVLAGIAVEHQLVVHDLVGGAGLHRPVGEAVARHLAHARPGVDRVHVEHVVRALAGPRAAAVVERHSWPPVRS